MSVDEVKWLEIASKFQKTPAPTPPPPQERRGGKDNLTIPATVPLLPPHHPSPAIKKPKKLKRSSPPTRTAQIERAEETSNNNASIESRLSEMEKLLKEKTSIIERQRTIIARLNHNLASATTKSIAASYGVQNSDEAKDPFRTSSSQNNAENLLDNTGLLLGGYTTAPIQEENTGGLVQERVRTRSTGRRGSEESEEEQDRLDEQLSVKSEGDDDGNDRGMNEGVDKHLQQQRGSFHLQLAQRLDNLTRRMDKLEARLPERIRSICAELMSQKETCHCHNGCKAGCSQNFLSSSSCHSAYQNSSDLLPPPFPLNPIPPPDSCSCPSCKFLRPTSPGPLGRPVNNSKCNGHHHRNAVMTDKHLRFKAPPSITPKSNFSADYRLQHALQQQRAKERDKRGNAVVGNELSGSFSLSTIEDKLASIENVVSRFKEYLFKVLYSKLQL